MNVVYGWYMMVVKNIRGDKMPKIIVEQYIKEEDEIDLDGEFDVLGAVELPERFSFIVKFERKVHRTRTELKVSMRDLRVGDIDYRIIHESENKEDYKTYVDFFKKEGYHKL